jgi:hypothetical protein
MQMTKEERAKLKQLKHLMGRKPLPPPSKNHTDKKAYNRRQEKKINSGGESFSWATS